VWAGLNSSSSRRTEKRPGHREYYRGQVRLAMSATGDASQVYVLLHLREASPPAGGIQAATSKALFPVAEGVETKGQAILLRQLDRDACPYSRDPVTRRHFAKLLNAVFDVETIPTHISSPTRFRLCSSVAFSVSSKARPSSFDFVLAANHDDPSMPGKTVGMKKR
jgi:hypothetical protein